MAIIKVMNKKGKYHDTEARETVVNYILNPSKTLSGFMGVTSNVDPLDIAGSMNYIARHYHKEKGIQLRHTVISFTPDEIDDPEIVNEIACKITTYVGRDYQSAFAVHENTNNLHFHLISNSVGYKSGRKYHGNQKDYRDFIKFATNVLHSYGIYEIYTVSPLSDMDIQE